jgi:tetratricopeptide (TPR) repeat protein
MDDHLKQLILLGREHYSKREFDRAEYLLRQVTAETDRHADVYDMLGVIAHSRGDFAQAQRHFEKAVTLNPNYTEAQLNLMVTYNDLGKYDKAREVYAQIRHRGSDGAARHDPFARGKIANMHAETAQAYLDLGMAHEAIRELERAVGLCPTFLDLRTRLAVLYRDTGSIELAKGQLEAALDQNPNFVPARQTLAVILLSHGDHEGAIVELERALQTDPENRSAQMYLRLAKSQRDR